MIVSDDEMNELRMAKAQLEQQVRVLSASLDKQQRASALPSSASGSVGSRASDRDFLQKMISRHTAAESSPAGGDELTRGHVAQLRFRAFVGLMDFHFAA